MSPRRWRVFGWALRPIRDYDPARAAALESYFRYARDNDLFLSYVIINPQSDKARSAGGQPDPHLVASVVDEDSGGITIRGAKMLATSGVMANELMVSGFQALQAGDEAYAFTAVVPLGAKGLTLLSRRSYEQNATSEFDYPLSSRFDENDAVVHFDDVKIPWDRVFVFKDLRMANAQWHDTRAHVFQNYQCIVRLMAKLEIPARTGAQDRRDQQHHQLSAGARNPGLDGGEGQQHRGACDCDGTEGRDVRGILRA